MRYTNSNPNPFRMTSLPLSGFQMTSLPTEIPQTQSNHELAETHAFIFLRKELTLSMPAPSKYPTCTHIMPSGRLCQCPAKDRTPLCINHARDRQRLRNLQRARQFKDKYGPKRPDYRPQEDINAQVFESMHFPPLEDREAIAITLTNAIRLLGGGHITPRAYEGIVNACRIAEINLRKGNAFSSTYEMQPGLVDNDPIPPFGDAEGFVLPEESYAKQAHDELKQMMGADEANLHRAGYNFMDHLYEPLDYPGLDPTAAAQQAYLDRKQAQAEREKQEKDEEGRLKKKKTTAA